MKKFLFTSILSLSMGYAAAQVAKIDTNFHGNPCDLPVTVSLINQSSAQGSIDSTKWTITDPSGNVIFHNKDVGINSPTIVIFTQPGTYTAVMCVNWGSTTRCDSIEITVGPSLPKYTVSKTLICSLPDTIRVVGFDMSMNYEWEIIPPLQGNSTIYGRVGYFYFVNMDIGTHKLVLTATDACGTTLKDTTTLHIYNSNISADFTDDGHEFPCPEDGTGWSRTIQFFNQSQGRVAYLSWTFGHPESGNMNNVSGRIDQEYAVNPVHRYPKAGKYDITLVVTDSNGCTDTLLKKEHVIILGPRGSFTYEGNGECVPLSVDFTPSLDTTDNYFYYPDSLMIITGDGTALKSTNNMERYMRHVYQKGGAYFPTYYLYKAVHFNGQDELCLVQMREKDTIYVIDLQPNFDTTVYYSELPIIINNTSTWIPDYLPIDSLVWEFDNGGFSTDFDGITTYNKEGKYSVQLTMKVLGCVKSVTKEIETVEYVGIKQLTIDNEQLTIYPNPTTGKLTINNEQLTIKNVEIFDVVGRKLSHFTIGSVSGAELHNSQFMIDISHLANGLYFLKIDGKTFKVVKN